MYMERVMVELLAHTALCEVEFLTTYLLFQV